MKMLWQDIKYNMPFATSYALQEYRSAEEGLIEAANAQYTHWYIDGSLQENLPDTWDDKRIGALQEKIEAYKVNPIFH